MLTVATMITAVIMMIAGGVKPLNATGYLITFLFCVFFVLTVASMIPAMSSGPLGLTVLIQNSSLMVPVVVGILFWNEKLTWLKGIGIAFILVLLVLSAFAEQDDGEKSGWNKKRWILFTGLAFIGDSALSILQSMMSRACTDTDSITFTFWTSVFSVLVAGLLTLYCYLRKCNHPLIRDERGKNKLMPLSLCYLGIGVGTAGGNCFTIMALLTMTSLVLFPIRMGGLVLVMWLLGILVYREKVTRTGLLMLIIGLAGIIMLNM